MKIRKITAFIIDFIIVSIISYVAINILNTSRDIKYDIAQNNLRKEIQTKSIDELTTYIDKNNKDLNYKYRYTILKRYSIANGIHVIWFIVLGYLTSFQTLGKYLLKIKISYEKPSFWRHALREILQIGLSIIVIITGLSLSWFSMQNYNFVIMNLEMILGLLMIINVLYMLFNKDAKSLVDKMLGSKVVKVEEK